MKSLAKSVMIASVLMLVAGCQTAAHSTANKESAGSPEHGLVGGWSEAPIDENINDIAKFAVEKIDAKHPGEEKLAFVVSAKQQVVAGMNYDLLLEMKNGQHWRVVVYKDLQGHLYLTSSSLLD